MEGAAYASVASDNTIAYTMEPLIQRGAAFSPPATYHSVIIAGHLEVNAAHYTSRLKFTTTGNFAEHLIGEVFWDAYPSMPRNERASDCVVSCTELALKNGRLEALSYVEAELVIAQVTKLRCLCVAHGRDQDATFAPSPEPPDDVQVADFVQRYSVPDSSEYFDLYLVSPRRWGSSLPPPNALQYNGQGIDGRGVSYVLNPWTYFHNGVQLTLKDGTIDASTDEIATTGLPNDNDEATKICIGLCSEKAAADGEDVFRGSWSGTPRKCYCAYGGASVDDQEDPQNGANILDGTSFIASLCPNSVPDPTESRYVWTKPSRRWCSGAVSQDHAGVRLLTSTLLPTLIDPADRAETCQTLCESSSDCRVAELHTVSWNDVAGAVLANPPSPPPPPAPPPGTPTPSPSGSPPPGHRTR